MSAVGERCWPRRGRSESAELRLEGDAGPSVPSYREQVTERRVERLAVRVFVAAEGGAERLFQRPVAETLRGSRADGATVALMQVTAARAGCDNSAPCAALSLG